MLKNIAIIFIALLLAGCWGKSSLHSQANLKNELLAYTQKYDKAQTLLVATYLNPIYQGEFIGEFEGSDIFIISIYPANKLPKSITINSKNANFTKLDKDDKLTALTSVNLPWSSHYKADIQAQNTNILNLDITLDDNSTAKLQFQKIARSLYWHTR